jgi:uncharacterized protein (DUF305 family)
MSRTTLFRRVLITATSIATAVTLAACGSSGGDSNAGATSGGMSEMPGMNQSSSAPSKSWNDADVTFAQMMIPDHQMVAKMAALAETKASNAQLKTLATQMKAGQSQAVETLSGWLKAWGKPTTSDMAGMNMPGGMTDADMDKLKAKTGMEFDMLFAQMMITHHNGSMQMCRDEQANGLSTEAKAMAEAMIKTQTSQVTALQKFAQM